MRLTATLLLVATALMVAGCRGEPVPRDYQNNPPAMTDPPDSAAEAPRSQSSTINPEPDRGAEGTSAPYEPTKPPEEAAATVTNR